MGWQQLFVGRRLEFKDKARYSDNIYGNPSYGQHVYSNDFDTQAADETNDIAVNESHGGTGAINVAKNGTYRLTTGAVDDDKVELATELVWYPSCACVMEVRIKVDVITDAKINCGFSDAKSEANDATQFSISGTTVGATALANAVCFVFDTDGDSDYWYYGYVKAGTASGSSIALAPEAGTYEIFRIALDTAGNATYYRNGVKVANRALAITTTTALTPYVAVQLLGNAGVARNLDVDYIKCWQNRG